MLHAGKKEIAPSPGPGEIPRPERKDEFSLDTPGFPVLLGL
jgi:hypothetical protein